jgi:hypothetical protein
MKKLSIAGAAAGALLCMAPVSFDGSAAPNGGLLGVKVAVAKADGFEPPRKVRRAARTYGAVYDPHCGGPYARAGWNGGTYWGGPWMDLRCYGVPVVEYPAPNPFWWYW